ncbi:anthrone oxygenase family protein [uncultured Roseobacter sp.]|uniref:anthrone oxygenase family protein n=1 Tax=uncultured Roseobacter sp. TaxID=114847 RepID=UPI0026113A8D|nr:anthrone oxygenase family protein [uncultured Roseobacter sp.]
MSRLKLILCLVPIVLFGAIGGFFYAYSVSVMQGLDNLPEIEAIHAMQLLNQGTRNMVFLFTFLFTPIIAFGNAVALYLLDEREAAGLLLIATVIYFLGSFLPTVNINVPLNTALEALDPARLDPARAPEVWSEFHASWTFWNTIRAVMALLALTFAALSMYSFASLKRATT